MVTGLVMTAPAHRLRLLDGVVALWVVFWLTIGTGTAVSVWDLGELGTTLSRSGQALDDAGDALQQLGRIPLVGDRPERLGDEVRRTAAEVTVRGRETRANLRRLAILLGLSVALIPSVPVLALYLANRSARRRVLRDIESRLRQRPDDPWLERYLAQRAVVTLPLSQLPAGAALRDGDPERILADAELGRLGLRRR